MDLPTKDYGYDKENLQGTGGCDKPGDYKTILYPFDKYQIKINLSSTNEFLGISEVNINKDFLSYKQKISQGFHDVDKFYKEEDK